MKRAVGIVLTVMLLLSAFACLNVSAETAGGPCGDNASWAFDAATGVLTVSGTGDMYNYAYDQNSPWHVYSGLITAVVIKNGITGIGSHAFWCCCLLKSVSLPDSLKSIGSQAFSDCTALENIAVPSGVISIGGGAFNYCISLKGVDVSEGNAYYSSENGILFSKNKATLVLYPAGRADENYTVPNSVESIKDYAFAHCSSLKSIAIPNSVKSIGVFAFMGCSSLEHITVPKGVTRIEDGVFMGCSALSSITVSSSVVSIGGSAFGDGVNSVTSDSHNYEYGGCTSLKRVYYTGTRTEWSYISIGFCNDCFTSADVIYNYRPAVLGDVNGDGEVDNLDAAIILRYDAGITELDGARLQAADVNGDGYVDNLDAARILRYDAGF